MSIEGFQRLNLCSINIDLRGHNSYIPLPLAAAHADNPVWLPNFGSGELFIRGIAQSGSAPALGAGCREFESLYPDQF